MSDQNVVCMSGRLTAKPEIKYLQSGEALCKFSLAVNKLVKKGDTYEDEAIFVNQCTAWGKLAENIEKYFDKGDQIIVRGHLDVNKWEDPDGKKHSILFIQIETFSFGAKKKPAGENERSDKGCEQNKKTNTAENEGVDKKSENIPF